MKLVYTLLALLTANLLHAQTNREIIPRWSADLDIGSSFLAGRPDNVDQQFSGYTKIGFSYRYALGKQWHAVNTGLAIESDRHLTDGYFVVNGGKYTFTQTPSNYKLNELSITYLNIPLQYQYWQHGQGLSFGPVFSYQLSAKSRYKVNDTKFKEDAPIENKFRWGLSFEVLTTAPRWGNRKHAPLFGFGFYYQVSDLVSTGSSFHPITAYLRAGWAIKWLLAAGYGP